LKSRPLILLATQNGTSPKVYRRFCFYSCSYNLKWAVIAINMQPDVEKGRRALQRIKKAKINITQKILNMPTKATLKREDQKKVNR
ncbi:hypothetical protein, partial [Thermodesulfitimonas sp.]